MRILIMLCLALFNSVIVANEPISNMDGLSGSHGEPIDVVKECLFHEELYETHSSVYINCSYDVPPHVTPNGKHVPHDPECFDERNRPIF